MSSPLVFRFLLAVGLCVVTAASCSSPSDPSAATTSTGVDVSPATFEDSSTSIPAAEDAISVAVYWNRPYGDARPIDIPGYADPVDGPYPYVLFGSVTNVGTRPIAQPELSVDWYLDGESIHSTTTPVRAPRGGTLAELAVGASADVIVVVDSEPVATRLADAQPSFGLSTP